MCEFEKKVKDKLDDILKDSGLPVEGLCPCLAVSGGADSIALLLSMSEIFSPLYVITVNHNIRPAAESRGDADFVLELCAELNRRGRKVLCQLVELEAGKVGAVADERGGGIEEAARFLRYQAFEKFMAAHGLNLLCTAHTMNDQLETLLMRFLQGSPAEAAGGIRSWRRMGSGDAVLARPLLDLSRADIEEYVSSRGFTWRTDKTNFETDYLRNRIRLKMLPFLGEQFPGWQKGLLSGAEKACEDAQLILSCVDKVPVSELLADGSVEIAYDEFKNAPSAVQRRLLLAACNKAGERARITNQFVKDVLAAVKETDAFTKHFAGIDIVLKKNRLFVKKHTESNTDLFFSDIIEKTGSFEFPFGTLDVFNYREENGKKLVTVCAGESSIAENISLPFCIRNARLGDTVLSADGSLKKVSDVFSDWHVVPEKKELIPVIQTLNEKSQGIKAILAGFLGYKDWIVKL